MSNCCICGKKIGDSFWENKYKLPYGLLGCYQCADLFGKIKKAENEEQIQNAQNVIRNKMKENNASLEAFEAVEEEFKRIDDSKHYMERKEQEEAERYKEQEARKRVLMVTTGHNFEGYRITKYIDIVHGEYIASNLVSTIEHSLPKAKYAAQEKMIDQAVRKGANGVIGIDFEFTAISISLAAVMVSGTAVVIEKIES